MRMMHRGNDLMEAGRKPEQAIAVLSPDHTGGRSQAAPALYSNIGTALRQPMGRLKDGHRRPPQGGRMLKTRFCHRAFQPGQYIAAGKSSGAKTPRDLQCVKAIELIIRTWRRAHSDLGNILYKMGKPRGLAIKSYRTRHHCNDPGLAEAYSNLANPLTDNMQLGRSAGDGAAIDPA